MQTINLPEFEPVFKTQGQKKYIFDSFRKKFVTLTPEEWVRQHWAHFLINFQSVPKTLLAVEASLTYNNMNKRCDILVYDKVHKPVLIVECKAPNVKIDEKTCWQIATYNFIHKAKYLIVSNGIEHFLFSVDFNANIISRLDNLPDFFDW